MLIGRRRKGLFAKPDPLAWVETLPPDDAVFISHRRSDGRFMPVLVRQGTARFLEKEGPCDER